MLPRNAVRVLRQVDRRILLDRSRRPSINLRDELFCSLENPNNSSSGKNARLVTFYGVVA